MNRTLLYCAFFIVVSLSGMTCGKSSSETSPPLVPIGDIDTDVHLGKKITVQGTVKRGSEVNFAIIRSDCPRQPFLVDEKDDWFPLGTRIKEKNNVSEVIWYIGEDYFGKKVEITGTFSGTWCEHLCCDSVIEVESITVIE